MSSNTSDSLDSNCQRKCHLHFASPASAGSCVRSGFLLSLCSFIHYFGKCPRPSYWVKRLCAALGILPLGIGLRGTRDKVLSALKVTGV